MADTGIPAERYSAEQKARLNAIIDQHLAKSWGHKRPTAAQIDRASGVLMWLSEECDDGQLRDMISMVRHELDKRRP